MNKRRTALLSLAVGAGVTAALVASASAGDEPATSSPLNCSVVAGTAITPDLSFGKPSAVDALFVAAEWPDFVDVPRSAFEQAQVIPEAKDQDAADSFPNVDYLVSIDGRAAAIVTVEQLDDDATGSWYLTGYSLCSPLFPKDGST